MAMLNHRIEEDNPHTMSPLGISIGVVLTPLKEGKEIANSQLASVFPLATMMPWTRLLSSKRQILTKRKRSIAKLGDASNVANKAISHEPVLLKGTDRTQTTAPQTIVPWKSRKIMNHRLIHKPTIGIQRSWQLMQ